MVKEFWVSVSTAARASGHHFAAIGLETVHMLSAAAPVAA